MRDFWVFAAGVVVGFACTIGAALFAAHKSTYDTSPDYKEDLELEDGRVYHQCCYCGESFYGHKRRMLCRRCYVDRQQNR